MPEQKATALSGCPAVDTVPSQVRPVEDETEDGGVRRSTWLLRGTWVLESRRSARCRGAGGKGLQQTTDPAITATMSALSSHMTKAPLGWCATRSTMYPGPSRQPTHAVIPLPRAAP